MTPLPPEFLQEQRQRLLAERQQLAEELGRIAKKDPRVPQDYHATFPEYGRDEEDNAQEEEDYAARRGVEQSLETRLRDVDSALQRLEENTYGVCRACSGEIGAARLNANPAATACIRHG